MDIILAVSVIIPGFVIGLMIGYIIRKWINGSNASYEYEMRRDSETGEMIETVVSHGQDSNQ